MGRYQRKRSFLVDLIIECFKQVIILLEILTRAFIWLLLVVLPGVIYLIWSAWGYSKSEYRRVTNNSLLDVYFDKGKRGEYLIYRCLRGKVENAKWLFNVYLPREDGRTTEIDVMMIHTSGIYVFESKNYSGWIYGSYDRDKWTQCIKPYGYWQTKKYHFLNPIIQNEIHVKYLKPLLTPNVQEYICPIVVFGNRCELKNIYLDTRMYTVVRRNDIVHVLNKRITTHTISEQDVENTYSSLYEYTQVDVSVKNKHVEDIEQRYREK